MSTTTIAAGAPIVTLINVFEVAPDRQAALIELLERATREVIRKQPGFVSANVHRGLDGTRVANYAQWASLEDFERMLQNREAQAHMSEAAAMAVASPVLYEVASVHR
jgi:heme-degrading monooxygenase HmoA